MDPRRTYAQSAERRIEMFEIGAGAQLGEHFGRDYPEALLIWVTPCRCCLETWHMRGPFFSREAAVQRMRYLFAKDPHGNYINPENFSCMRRTTTYEHAGMLFHTPVSVMQGGMVLLGNKQLVDPRQNNDLIPGDSPHHVPFEVSFISESWRLIKYSELDLVMLPPPKPKPQVVPVRLHLEVSLGTPRITSYGQTA